MKLYFLHIDIWNDMLQYNTKAWDNFNYGHKRGDSLACDAIEVNGHGLTVLYSSTNVAVSAKFAIHKSIQYLHASCREMAVSHQWFVKWSPPPMVISDISTQSGLNHESPYKWNEFLNERTESLQDFHSRANLNSANYFDVPSPYSAFVDRERSYKRTGSKKKHHWTRGKTKNDYDGMLVLSILFSF